MPWCHTLHSCSTLPSVDSQQGTTEPMKLIDACILYVVLACLSLPLSCASIPHLRGEVEGADGRRTGEGGAQTQTQDGGDTAPSPKEYRGSGVNGGPPSDVVSGEPLIPAAVPSENCK